MGHVAQEEKGRLVAAAVEQWVKNFTMDDSSMKVNAPDIH
jgi:hypothetical protein